MSDGSVSLDDASVRPATQTVLTPITIGVDALAWPLTNRLPFQVEIGVNHSGRLAAEGSAGLAPLELELSADLSGLELSDFSAYVAEFAAVKLKHGVFGAKFRAQLAGETLTAAGDLALDEFAVVDAAAQRPLLRWSGLAVSGVKFDSDRQALGIATVSLRSPEARLILETDGSSNLSAVMVSAPSDS